MNVSPMRLSSARLYTGPLCEIQLSSRQAREISLEFSDWNEQAFTALDSGDFPGCD